MSDPALERLAGVVFATIYPYRKGVEPEVIAAESARWAVSIRCHLNALTRPAEAESVVAEKACPGCGFPLADNYRVCPKCFGPVNREVCQ